MTSSAVKMAVFCGVLGGAAYALGEDTPAGASACRSDWRLCKDVGDYYKFNRDKPAKVSLECQDEAERRSRYGDVIWREKLEPVSADADTPMKFYKVAVYVGDAQFHNGHGAMENMVVRCFYWLKRGQIKELTINRD